jgi:hypothetical protein
MKNFIANAEKKLDAWGEKLEKINITYPSDLVTGILFLVVSVVVLLIMPDQVAVSEKDLVNGRAFPTMLAYLMLAMSLLLVGNELVKLITKKPLVTKTMNLLVEVKALIIIGILIVTYLLAKVTDLFVIGGLFCAVSFLVFFRCKKKSYYAITVSAAVLIWVVFRFVLSVNF